MMPNFWKEALIQQWGTNVSQGTPGEHSRERTLVDRMFPKQGRQQREDK